jgi:hypothetical protein
MSIGKYFFDEKDTSDEIERWVSILFWPLLATVFIIGSVFVLIYKIFYELYCIYKKLKKYGSK